jgi:hypothetical protein
MVRELVCLCDHYADLGERRPNAVPTAVKIGQDPMRYLDLDPDILDDLTVGRLRYLVNAYGRPPDPDERATAPRPAEPQVDKEDETFSCTYCDSSARPYKTLKYYLDHVFNEHGVDAHLETMARLYADCSLTDPFRCRHCYFVAVTSGGFLLHLRSCRHNPESPNFYGAKKAQES